MQMDGHGVSLVVFLDYTQSIGQPQPNAQTQDGWNNRQEFIIIISVSICIRSAIIIITAILVSLSVRIVVGVAVADFFGQIQNERVLMENYDE